MERKARSCRRCGHVFWNPDSEVCDECWNDMGQRSLFEEEQENFPLIDTEWDRIQEAKWE